MQEMLIEELNQTIALLEADIPANPASPKGQRLEGQFEREMKRYFKDLENAISIEQLELLYYRYVEQE